MGDQRMREYPVAIEWLTDSRCDTTLHMVAFEGSTHPLKNIELKMKSISQSGLSFATIRFLDENLPEDNDIYASGTLFNLIEKARVVAKGIVI